MASDDEDKPKKVDVFLMGSNDNSGNLITPIQLKGDNYDKWARAIRTALKAKRNFGFLEGTVQKPTEDAKLDDRYTVHSMLVAWLMNTIESSIRSTLTYYEDAREMWMVLKGRFCVVNGTRICQLKSSLTDYKQGKTEFVASYFGRISKIWDDLATYVKLPTCSCDGCSCGGCTYGLAAQYQKLLQEDRLHWFLVGVDSVYASARSQLLKQDPLPSLDRAYQVLTQEERLRGGEFQGRDGRRGGRGSTSGGRGRGGSTFGGGWKTDQPPVRAHKMASGTSNQTGGTQGQPRTSEQTGLANITSEQWQNILDVLNLPKPKD
ncbi:Retrovirus-related Pol polyprotein from transposon TNT 1-94 [Melia azedarach]|uniref:Retrovirus-related Pol polyprotein from transposon TNT 1-94 n=1 Tax=Melia azedarach TaxID=155640 RepID=A0ACC1YNB0_MELAZ|nr:Retrovirus-related Pol polyprotein from transposon TNT 1-94 [Melia azedarach]